MNLLWQITYVIVFIYITFVIPFMIFMYETDEDDSCYKKFTSIMCKMVCLTAVAYALSLLFWGTCKEVNIAVDVLPDSISNAILSSDSVDLATTGFPLWTAVIFFVIKKDSNCKC